MVSPGRPSRLRCQIQRQTSYDQLYKAQRPCYRVLPATSRQWIVSSSPRQWQVGKPPAMPKSHGGKPAPAHCCCSAAQPDSVCRPVAVHGEYAAPPKSGKLYNEDDWNETSSIENGQAYHLSKASELPLPWWGIRTC